MTMDAVTALRLQLIDAGWNCVPSSPTNKACYIQGWPEIETSGHHINNWALTHPADTNTSLVCNKNYVAIDIDVASDADLAQVVHALAFQHFGVTDFVRIGRAPKRLLVYRQEPGSITSKSYKSMLGNGDGIEILSGGKNFVAFGLHPDKRRPYQWVGTANPAEDSPTDAPLVTQVQVDAFVDAVHAVMPFAHGAGGNGTGRPTTIDTQRVVSAEGLVTDGRENLLRDCIYRAANELHAARKPLTPDIVAAGGWDLFTARAWLADGKYQPRHALDKARALIRRVHDGQIKLTGIASKMRVVELTYSAKRSSGLREALGRILVRFTDMVLVKVQ